MAVHESCGKGRCQRMGQSSGVGYYCGLYVPAGINRKVPVSVSRNQTKTIQFKAKLIIGDHCCVFFILSTCLTMILLSIKSTFPS